MKYKYYVEFNNLKGKSTGWFLKNFKDKEDLVGYLLSIGIKFNVYVYLDNEKTVKSL